MEIAQVSSRGQVTLPAELRKRLGLRPGDVLIADISEGRLILTPAVVTPVEHYTDERVAEFDEASELTGDELASARQRWSPADR